MKKKHNWITQGEEYGPDTANPEAPYLHGAQDMGEYHNGPKCKDCGYEFCHHCFPEGFESVCGSPSLGADDSKLNGGLIAFSESLRRGI